MSFHTDHLKQSRVTSYCNKDRSECVYWSHFPVCPTQKYRAYGTQKPAFLDPCIPLSPQAMLPMENTAPQIWQIAANSSTKQLKTAESGWSHRLKIGWEDHRTEWLNVHRDSAVHIPNIFPHSSDLSVLLEANLWNSPNNSELRNSHSSLRFNLFPNTSMRSSSDNIAFFTPFSAGQLGKKETLA
jgi:hypothetical protein